MLWRPGRGDRRPRQTGRSSQHQQTKPSSGKGSRTHAGKHDRGPGKGQRGDSGKRGKQTDKPVDPDSPFAKLAQLKTDLEKGDGPK